MLQLEEIVSFIWRTVSETLGVHSGAIFVRSSDDAGYVAIYPALAAGLELKSSHPLVLAMREDPRRVHSRYDFDADRGSASAGSDQARGWREFEGMQLLVPLAVRNELIRFGALGRKESGAFFSIDDVDFLRALGNQSAVSIANALAYGEIRKLNAVLEERVAQRTAELSQSNSELQLSLGQLERAYGDLQRSQESLVRAERMAALGRLAAGIAHEINTPLGASMTSIELLRGLVAEYISSAGDDNVSVADHREIATEMASLLETTRAWLEKAGAQIRSFKLHTRALQSAEEREFAILQTINEVALLLSHRLRLSQSTLAVKSGAGDPILYGDPGKLGQVLTNLISNAIDAHLEAKRGGEISIDVSSDGESLMLKVTDHGNGIPEARVDRIFDEFYSSKPLGEGTGLGLPISRDIISNFFAGSISVDSAPGEGSTFTVRIPLRDRRQTSLPAVA